MIVSAALCPSPPLLAGDLTGQADVLPDLRAACAAAVARLLAAAPDMVAVVGTTAPSAAAPAAPAQTWDPASRLDLAGYAPALAELKEGAAPGLPLSLGIGSLLLDEAGHAGPRTLLAVGESEPPGECARLGRRLADTAPHAPRVALLIMGDGTARRSVSAPGYLDERAEPFDGETERAVREGDLAALAALDPSLAAELMATARAPLQVFAAALAATVPPGTRPAADILYAAAPFGVAYLVAACGSPGTSGTSCW